MTGSLAQKVLDYWHCIEFFNHYNLDDKIKEARGAKRREFFVTDKAGVASAVQWASHDGKIRYVYLLPFDVSQITELALRHNTASSDAVRLRDEEFAPEGRTCFASLRLSAQGEPDFKSLSISTLPWAGGMLLGDDLSQLQATLFEESVADLKTKIESAWSCRTEEHGTPGFLQVVAELLVDWAGFRPRGGDIAWVDVHEEANRAPARQAELLPASSDAEPKPATVASAEELPILNSFYYHDLKRAAAVLRAPPANTNANPLAAYLSAGGIDKLDLESPAGEQAIRAALDPANNNPGRWPVEPHRLQSLMQQFALNKMLALAPGAILSVNGPPGTGKTTLVKDLIADLIVQRAAVLATLNRAADGLGAPVRIGFGSDTLLIPTLAPRLTGYEILVASSNNGAVENLSLELPQRKDLAAEHRGTLRHFVEVATKYAGARLGQTWKQPDEPVWGLISAALGKSKNRQRFLQVFSYTAKAPGQRLGKQFVTMKKEDYPAWDAEGAMSYWRFLRERKAGVASFDGAKRRFIDAQSAYQAYLAYQTQLRNKWLEFVEAWQAAQPWLELHADLQQGMEPLGAEIDAGIARVGRQLAQLELTLWPSSLRWLMRWFSRRKFLAWLDARAKALQAAGLRDAFETVLKLQQKTGMLQLWDGKTLDSHYNQQAALWHGRDGNLLRNELFAAAMALHQAFVLEAASDEVGKAMSNLFSRRITEGTPLPVWQWLFMLVPVVSSTFASVRNQFRDVEPGGLGWLIIDEAGQAVPQAAVGALLRTRRAVVVGDPLQIEPVVGLPTRLVEKLGELSLGPQAPDFAVHRHSVQTLADRAHPYGVQHPHRADEFIGIPLVMHRRCDNPMFDIANKIAYRERMRHAKDGKVAPHPLLGLSDWWDVKGRCTEGKYVAEQGMYLMDRLCALYLAEVGAGRSGLPALFVITPFREVKAGLLQLLPQASEWAARLTPHGIAVPDNLGVLRDSIGTVHTFQGKEAPIVFFVLGCDEERSGAMNWAAGSPNLLNVAVTRAKQHCYIIGDKSLWGSLRYFDVAVQQYALIQSGSEDL